MEIRKLNLVMTYPVKWELYEVMSNFVQNFYDAVGNENFLKHFSYEYIGNNIILTSDVGFDKEWLYFLGASSKRDGSKTYAGCFGEGFKIASLVARRDFGLDIHMESKDWELTVITEEDQIDGKPVEVLAYQIEKRASVGGSKLVLGNAAEVHFKELERQIENYYYEENRKFGACIAKGETFAVYEAVPGVGSNWCKGYLFVNYRCRQYLRLPIAVCNHDFHIEGDDRDRRLLSLGESNEAIREVFRQLDAFQALRILEICRPRWKDTYDRNGVMRNWYSMLEILIIKVSEDWDARQTFLKKYGDKLITKGFYSWTTDFQRKVSMKWFRKSEYHETREVVCELFSLFFLPTIIGLCRSNHGLDVDTAPTTIQQKYIDILSTVSITYFGDLFCYERIPDCRILICNEVPIAGKAKSVRETKRIENKIGLRVVERITTIYIREDILHEDCFSEALVVYLHELLHQFGGEGSIQFKKALLAMNQVIMEHLEPIKEYEEIWRKVEGHVIDQTGNCA